MISHLFKKALFSLLLVGISCITFAQNSYVYIEGIKGVPMNIVVNGSEIKSLAKNYILFETKQEGENVIDIKFAGAIFPTQNFVIYVIPNSSYGYKLAKANEDKFYLLDLVNNGKVVEPNTSVNIGLTTEENNIHLFNPEDVTIEEPKQKTKVKKVRKDESEIKVDNTPEIKEEKYGIVEVITSNSDSTKEAVALKKNTKVKTKKVKKKKEDVFAENIETPKEVIELPIINKIENKEVIDTNSIVAKKKKVKKSKKEKQESIDEANNNSDVKIDTLELNSKKVLIEEPKTITPKVNKCLHTASDVEINTFNEKLSTKTDDEAKLILLKKKFFTGCLDSKQLYSIVERFDTQYGRFSVVKFIKPEISDAENIVLLEPLFKYETYKIKLKKMSEE